MGRIVVAKRLIYSQFHANTFYPKRRSNMEQKYKSFGLSVITVSDSEISFEEKKGQSGKVSISDLQRFEVTMGTFTEYGVLTLEANGEEFKIHFVSNYNKDLKKMQEQLGFQNINEPETVKKGKEKKPRKSIAEMEAEMPESWKEKQAEKARVEQMKKDKIPFCPKCHSTSITYQDKKLSVGRAIVGGAVAGSTGAILGGISSKKGNLKCLNCGHTWKI